MFKYQINVALPDGKDMHGKPKYKYFFRTDWIDNESDARMVQNELMRRFDTCSVTVYRASRVMDIIVL